MSVYARETAAGPGDHCANCGQPLASDQRYCINCGERRGEPRFSFSALAGQPATSPAPAPARRSRRLRLSDGLGFILGVATLLLAMGVGVLIGHNSNPKAQQAAATPPQQVIKIEGGGGGSSSGGGGSSRQATHKTNTPALPTKKVTLSKKQTQAVNKAVNNVLGQGSKNLPPPTIQPGQSCTGSGCQNGHFTGNFFGGGQN